MGDALPPDPYIALGVAKDATAAAIKTQYRKLVLKFHPDKVQDESQKQAAADQFHKIQTAYEIVSDEARRARYDAQCKLAELRKDVVDRDVRGARRSSDDDRSPRYAAPPEPARDYFSRGDRSSTRVSPQYSTEERRPGYASQDYFDPEPRPNWRKDAEYERSSKRESAKDQKTTKSSKASSVGGRKKEERSSRDKKSKKSDRDVKQDRSRKYQPEIVEEDSESDPDPYERRRQEMRAEDDARRRQMREEEEDARRHFYETERRQREQAEQGYFGDERARKVFLQANQAREHIRSGRTPRTEEPPGRRPSPVRMASSRDYTEQRRPSPPRMSSSKEGVEFVRRGDRPYMTRKSSSRPQTTGHSAERRTREPEVVEETVRDAKRPPTLPHMKSSPPVVPQETRQYTEKGRSNSVQVDRNDDDAAPIPKMRRAETMPVHARTKESAPEKGSRLRNWMGAYPTPETSPERQQTRKTEYTTRQPYNNDVDYASPDDYDVEERKPQRATSHKRDRYEDTVAKDPRERTRSASTKHAAAQPPPLPRTTSTTRYMFPDGQETYSRPTVSRENSARGGLYGEIPTTSTRSSPGVPRGRYEPPAAEGYSRPYPAESVNMQSGFKTRESPSMSRRDTRSRQVA